MFDLAFDVLKISGNRHEYVYKAALFEKIQLGHHTLNTARMVNEFTVGQSKADTVLFNGTATAYEIKSERDNLSRLSAQITDYYKVFPFVNVIAGENHISSLESAFPREICILLLSKRYRIKTIRPAQANYERLSAQKILESIRLSEAKEMLLNMNIEIPEVPNTGIYDEISRIFKAQTTECLHTEMVRAVKKNRSLVSLKDYLDDIPKSLHSAVISANMKKNDMLGLLNSLSAPICNII